MTDQPDPTPPTERNVAYRGAPLDSEKGPGLGCFWIQMVALAVVVVLTPLSAAWNWPAIVSIVLFSTTLVLLLFVGQTVIFLLRLVAADRRAAGGRRRPMAGRSRTVGELEDAEEGEGAAGNGEGAEVGREAGAAAEPDVDETPGGGVRE